MKTIYQSQDIAFHAPTFKDATALLSLMDALTLAANHNRVAEFYNNLPKEEKNKYRRVWHRGNLDIQPEAVERILKILTDLGFEAQIDLKEVSLADLEQTKQD